MKIRTTCPRGMFRAVCSVVLFAFTVNSVGSNYAFAYSNLRPAAVDKRDGGKVEVIKAQLKDGGKAAVYDLHERAKVEIDQLANGASVPFYAFDGKSGGYTASMVRKNRLVQLLARDEAGLIEDEAHPGTYIWARKQDGAVVTSHGDLFISGRYGYPAMEDVPLGRIEFNRYTKIVPLAYNFFKTFLGKDEYGWISEILTQSKVILTAKDLGEKHYAVDKASKTLTIEKAFMDYLLHAGNKRPGMGLFAEAAIALSDKKFTDAEAKSLVNKIARPSLTGKSRLENIVYLFNLQRDIKRSERKLTEDERQVFLTDIMEHNRSLNGRRAAKLLRETFEYYGEISATEAESDLRAIAARNPQNIIIDPYVKKEDDQIIKYLDRTDSFRVNGKFMADRDLITGRNIVWDYEVDSTDAPLFGGKVAYTGMMQWAPGAITLPMFATAGRCFKDMIDFNNYKPQFEQIAKDLQVGLESLAKKYGYNSAEYNKFKNELVRDIAGRFQGKLDWGAAGIPPQLVQELKDSLKALAIRTNTSVFQLILAIRSSAIGEDSESASFAGRQDTSLFVTPLSEELAKMNINPEDYGYSWNDLKSSIQPWYDILSKVRAKLGDKAITEAMLDVFVKEWLANQRSLFNQRSIEYRLEKNIAVFTDDVEMSSVF
jgi:hypothetical protein